MITEKHIEQAINKAINKIQKLEPDFCNGF